MSVQKKRYPQISLPQAVGLVRKIKESEGTSPAADEILLKAMGYNSKNGRSLAVLSALRKYGLLEQSGGHWRVSKDAVTILAWEQADPNHPDRLLALRRAALAPELFAKLKEHYQDETPSVNNVAAYLETMDYNGDAAKTSAANYLETMDYIASGGSKTDSADDTQEVVAHDRKSGNTPINTQIAIQPQVMRTSPGGPQATPTKSVPLVRDLHLPLPGGSSATLWVPSSITEAQWKAMMTILEAMKPGLIEEAAPTSRDIPTGNG